VLRQSRLKVPTDFLSMLTVSISNSEEMAVFQATEVGNGDPSILINLVRIARGKTCLSSECEFSNAISKHLLGI
jgi:hypothetical protein